MSQKLFLTAAAGMFLMLAQACRSTEDDSSRLPYVIPDPQSMVVAGDPVLIPERPGSVAIALPDNPSPKLQLAAQLVRERLAEDGDLVPAGRQRLQEAPPVHPVLTSNSPQPRDSDRGNWHLLAP